MTVRSDEELEGLRAAGRLAAEVLRAMRAAVRPGISTGELDAIAERRLRAAGGRSAPALVYGFPGTTCISVGDEVVHGVPGGRRLGAGDVVKLDVTVEKDGYMADTACTVVVGETGGRAVRLAAAARAAFAAGVRQARPGAPVARIGRAVEEESRRRGFAVIRELSGHGIGRTIHEPPRVPNYDDPRVRQRLEEGAVITIEPLLSTGSGEVYTAADGWTVRTADRALSAHHEHTVVVTRGGPLLLTA
jgi:methionyl aminopeptidase